MFFKSILSYLALFEIFSSYLAVLIGNEQVTRFESARTSDVYSDLDLTSTSENRHLSGRSTDETSTSTMFPAKNTQYDNIKASTNSQLLLSWFGFLRSVFYKQNSRAVNSYIHMNTNQVKKIKKGIKSKSNFLFKTSKKDSGVHQRVGKEQIKFKPANTTKGSSIYDLVVAQGDE